MLLGNATCLAYDIGIFDDDDEEHVPDYAFGTSEPDYRKTRLQYLCYIYVHSFSARYGRGSALLPKQVTTDVERWASQPDTHPPQGTPEEDWRYIRGAVGLTKLMKYASEVLFASKRTTRDLLRTGNYLSLLSHFEPSLKAWRQNFDMFLRFLPLLYSANCTAQTDQSRLMLLVEYQYIRLYINSLALQAVAERQSSQVVSLDGQAVRISEEESVYIEHVVDASKSILNYMIYEFAPRGYLRLSPVKVFLRIISAAVFLVKVLFLLSLLKYRLSLSVEVPMISTSHLLCWIQRSRYCGPRRLMICIWRTGFPSYLNRY